MLWGHNSSQAWLLCEFMVRGLVNGLQTFSFSLSDNSFSCYCSVKNNHSLFLPRQAHWVAAEQTDSCTTTRMCGSQSPAGSACVTTEHPCATKWSARIRLTATTQSFPTESAALSAPTSMVHHRSFYYFYSISSTLFQVSFLHHILAPSSAGECVDPPGTSFGGLYASMLPQVDMLAGPDVDF